MPPKVKICCIQSPEEARMAIQFGASAIGLVGRMPSGPGVIDDERIREISRSLPPGVSSFLLTCETEANAVASHIDRTQTDTIQLVDAPQEDVYDRIRTLHPRLRIVQVLHITDESSIEKAIAIAEYVDAILLDSGNPSLAVKELGGTGRTHNWSISARIVQASPKPVYLAGGLNAQNVRQAMETVQPFGLDLCSGVRTEGKLDPWKLEAFFKAIL